MNFNSIKVRLERECRTNDRKEEVNFNSIKVRLERSRRVDGRAFIEFQFHKGTIRTLRCPKRCLGTLHFNSIKVRLEQEIIVFVLKCLL